LIQYLPHLDKIELSQIQTVDRRACRQHRCVRAVSAGAQRASGVGITRPPRVSPGGKRKRGHSDSVLPHAISGLFNGLESARGRVIGNIDSSAILKCDRQYFQGRNW
jgi:hypothetical protein